MAGINFGLSDRLRAYKSFVTESKDMATKEKTVASKVVEGGGMKISKSTLTTASGTCDQLHFWGRSTEMKNSNNEVRRDIFDAVVEQFGGDVSKIPDSVKDAMLLEDSGLDKANLKERAGAFATGKPLLARRIDAIITEVEKVLARKNGAVAFNLFYDEMKESPGGDVKADFKREMQTALQNIMRSAGVRTSKIATYQNKIETWATQMAELLGDDPKTFMRADMEPLLKACCKELSADMSKDEKAKMKLASRSFIDSFSIERQMDEKIAAAYAKQYKLRKEDLNTVSVNDADRELARLQNKLAEEKVKLISLESSGTQTQKMNQRAKVDHLEKEVKTQRGIMSALTDKNLPDRRMVMDVAISELLHDKEFCALAAKKDFHLTTRADLAGKVDFEVHKECEKGTATFGRAEGCTSEAIAQYHKAHPDEKICVHVYGDRTFPLCYLLRHATTEEEAAARDADVKSWAHLIGTGKIKPSKKRANMYEFATDNMNSIQGFTIETKMNFTRQIKNAKPIKVTFIFSSMPSMPNAAGNLDEAGDCDFLKDCKDLHPEWRVKKSDLPRAQKFVSVFHEMFKKDTQDKKDASGHTIRAEHKYTPAEWQLASKFMKFGGKNDHFNVFGKNSRAEVQRLLDYVHEYFLKPAQVEKAVVAAKSEYRIALTNYDNNGAVAEQRKKLHDLQVAVGGLEKELEGKTPTSDGYEEISARLGKARAQLDNAKKDLENLPARLSLKTAEDALKKAQGDLAAAQARMNTDGGMAFSALETEAQTNYENVVRKRVRDWIVEARETGADALIGGPIGCGVFCNDPKVVARIIAEEFKANGGKMKFIYDVFTFDGGVITPGEEGNYEIFRAAFEKEGLAAKIENAGAGETGQANAVEQAVPVDDPIDTQFPDVGTFGKEHLRALVKKDGENAGQVLALYEKVLALYEKVSALDSALLQLLLHQPDFAARLDLLKRLEKFGNECDTALFASLIAHRDEMLRAEQDNGRELTPHEMLHILLPSVAESKISKALETAKNPGWAFANMINDLQIEVLNKITTDNNEAAAIVNISRTLLGWGFHPDVVEAKLKEDPFDPLTLPLQALLSGSLSNDKNLDEAKDTFARDVWGQKPNILVKSSSAEPGKEPEVIKFNSEQLIDEGVVQSMTSPAANDFADKIFERCASPLQAANVILSLTQSNSVASAISGVLIRSLDVQNKSCKGCTFEVTIDSNTHDVTVKKSSGPDSPVAHSMTFVFHADGTQEVTDRGTFTKNEQPPQVNGQPA